MGSYVYTLRKSTKEVLVDGIYPVPLLSMDFAFKPYYGWEFEKNPTTRNWNRQLRMADNAAIFHRDERIKQTGSSKNKFYISSCGYTEGARVFLIDLDEDDILPAAVYDDSYFDRDLNWVGVLKKVGRKWYIERENAI